MLEEIQRGVPMVSRRRGKSGAHRAIDRDNPAGGRFENYGPRCHFDAALLLTVFLYSLAKSSISKVHAHFRNANGWR